MKILIDGKEAVLKEGTSFQYISENSLFTGSDSYTLNITFPLRGCTQNLNIFGHINRTEMEHNGSTMEAEIHANGVDLYGRLAIVNVSDTEAKTQFLQGKAASNYSSTFDSIYINSVTYGSPLAATGSDFANYFKPYGDASAAKPGFVAFTWVNNTSGNLQNPTEFQTIDGVKYEKFIEGTLVCQPYLIYVLKKIFEEVGYSYDISELESSYWSKLVICNSLPQTWELDDFRYSLPYWTMSEFLEQLEYLTNGTFNIDETKNKVTFKFNKTRQADAGITILDNVIDEYKVEISDSESSSSDVYIEERQFYYTNCSDHMWKFYSCPWICKRLWQKEWTNVETMKANLDSVVENADLENEACKQLHYCKDEDTYFVLRSFCEEDDEKIIMRYQPVNEFCPGMKFEADEETDIELKIVPACIDFVSSNYGDALFMECGEYGSSYTYSAKQTAAAGAVDAGDPGDKKNEYFDKIYVGFWDGNTRRLGSYLPHPIIDKFEFTAKNKIVYSAYSLRPKRIEKNKSIADNAKYTFSFLSDTIPDVMSTFYIKGRNYLAKKITATFSEKGLSRLMKIECYRLA